MTELYIACEDMYLTLLCSVSHLEYLFQFSGQYEYDVEKVNTCTINLLVL
jgi:hypothetical protein